MKSDCGTIRSVEKSENLSWSSGWLYTRSPDPSTKESLWRKSNREKERWKLTRKKVELQVWSNREDQTVDPTKGYAYSSTGSLTEGSWSLRFHILTKFIDHDVWTPDQSSICECRLYPQFNDMWNCKKMVTTFGGFCFALDRQTSPKDSWGRSCWIDQNLKDTN